MLINPLTPTYCIFSTINAINVIFFNAVQDLLAHRAVLEVGDNSLQDFKLKLESILNNLYMLNDKYHGTSSAQSHI